MSRNRAASGCARSARAPRQAVARECPSSRCQRPNSHRRGRCFAHRFCAPFWSADAGDHRRGRGRCAQGNPPSRHRSSRPSFASSPVRRDAPSCRRAKTPAAPPDAGAADIARIGRNLGRIQHNVEHESPWLRTKNHHEGDRHLRGGLAVT